MAPVRVELHSPSCSAFDVNRVDYLTSNSGDVSQQGPNLLFQFSWLKGVVRFGAGDVDFSSLLSMSCGQGSAASSY